MRRKIFLDDSRKPGDVPWGGAPTKWTFPGPSEIYKRRGWEIVDTASSFVNLVDMLTQENMPLFVSFNHNLIDEHYSQGQDSRSKWRDKSVYKEKKYERIDNWTGFHCAEYLIEHLLKHKINHPPMMYCHSFNLWGAININYIIRKYQHKLWDSNI